jgi:hypothetical protein
MSEALVKLPDGYSMMSFHRYEEVPHSPEEVLNLMMSERTDKNSFVVYYQNPFTQMQCTLLLKSLHPIGDVYIDHVDEWTVSSGVESDRTYIVALAAIKQWMRVCLKP